MHEIPLPTTLKSILVCTVLGSLLCAPGIAYSANDLTELSLEALMEISVTSVSKKPQKMANAAAAAFVISQEDIRRSGATSIPELLRMVPGVQVARIDANKWAVSIRGFNGRFANKLLVLKDGRSIYTPLFSGVYWEQQDTPLEDIERIEVIRGPDAALWGSNAVNGVINIITKQASDTKGGLISAGGGSSEQGFGTLRYGMSTGNDTNLRIYGNYTNRGPGQYQTGNNANDAWQTGSTGFRMDSKLSDKDTITLQGDYFSGSYNETYNLYNLANPGVPSARETTARSNGINLLSRWQRTFSDTDSLSLQLYYDHYQRDMLVLGEIHDTADLDLQHRFRLGSRQDIVWGIGYRYSQDSLTNSPYIIFDNGNKGTSLFSGFIHDEITLLPEKLSLILGARLEHNDYSGFEIQPNARLIWTPTPQHSFWGSISRAVRTPSRGDQEIQYRFLTVPAAPTAPLPARVEIDGSSSMKSETVLAYELGYRTSPIPAISIDFAVFLNQYDRLRIPQPGAVSYAELPSNLVQPYILSNSMHGHTYGAELSATWKVQEWWHLQATYSYLCAIMYLDRGNSDPLAQINRSDATSGSPRHQGSIRSGFDLGKQVELDLWLRAVDRVDYIDQVSIPGYLTMDIRLAWKPLKKLELSVVGQNLFQNHHPEYIPEFINTTASEVPRSVYGKLTWRF
ncbi:MAG: TonB-dependent receptor [Geobacter sp.]|nr:TonB-dependent receptor [Geobacter sp.]